MYARLLLESLRRGTRRKLLAVTAVALGLLGATALAEVLLASGDRLAADLGSYGANLEMRPARGGATLPIADLAKVRRIFWRNNIVAVAPFHSLRVRFEPGGVVAPLVGTWFDHALEPGWRTGLPRTSSNATGPASSASRSRTSSHGLPAAGRRGHSAAR